MRGRLVGLILLSMTLASPAFGQQPDETLPGFKANLTYETSAIDNVNPFSGDVNVTIPLGPSYSLGAGVTFQIKAYSSAKFWYLTQLQCSTPGPMAAYINGDSTIGLGWTINLGYVSGERTYVAPDGSSHVLPANDLTSVATNDGSMLRIGCPQHDGQGNPTQCTVDFPDGTTETFQDPLPRVDSTPSSSDFTTPYGSKRLGLSSITNARLPGQTLLTVAYANGRPSSITLVPQQKTIVFNSVPFDASDGTTHLTWTVLNSIVFPAAGGKTETATMSYQNGWFFRSIMDETNAYCPNTPSVDSSFTVAVPLLSTLMLSDSGSSNTQTYAFGYPANGGSNDDPTNGVLSSVTLPTGGQIQYSFDKMITRACSTATTDFESSALVSCPYPTNPITKALGGAGNPCSGGAFAEYGDRSPGLSARTELDSNGVVIGTTNYYREQFFTASGDGNGCEGILPAARRTAIVAPDGNGGINTTKIIYSVVPNSGTTLQSNGLELERRYYAGADDSVTPLRTVINCYEDDSTAAQCGFIDTTGSTPLQYGLQNNVRRQATLTWYGVNPNGGGACSQDTTKLCISAVNSQYQQFGAWPGVGRYQVSTTSSNLTADVTRSLTTIWTPQVTTTGPWLLNLFSSKTTQDSGPFAYAPASVTSAFVFDTTNGFLKSTAVTDSTDGTVLHCYYPGNGTGASAADAATVYTTKSTTCPGSAPTTATSGNFLDTQTFTNGLILTRKRYPFSWQSLTLARDPATGAIISSTDPNSALTTSYAYDAFGRLLSSTPPSELATLIAYDDLNHRATVTRGTGTQETSTEYNYDYFGRLANEVRTRPSTDPSPFAYRRHTFNEIGVENFTSEWLDCTSLTPCRTMTPSPIDCAHSNQGTTRCDFDVFGRPETILQPDGTIVAKDYSEQDGSVGDLRVTTTLTLNGQAAQSVERRDTLNRVVAEKEPLGAGTSQPITWTYYDALDKVANVQQPDDNGGSTQVRSFTYDAFGFLTRESSPEKGTTTYSSYDAIGDLLAKSDGGISYSYAYDSAGRLQTLTAGGIRYLMNCWDGSAATPKCPDGTTSNAGGGTYPVSKLTRRFGYNPSFSTNPTVQEDFTYSNAAGRMSARSTTVSSSASTPAAQTVSESWTYNTMGLVSSYVHPHSGSDSTVDSSYDYLAGLPTDVKTGGGFLASSVKYNASGALNAWTTGTGNVTTTISPDPSGMPRPNAISTSNGSFTSGTYVYDAAGSILSIGTDSFGYDRRSRLTSSTVLGNGLTYQYDRWGNLNPSQVDYTTNRLNSSVASYDALGNLTTYSGQVYTYDSLSRQLDVNSGAESYLYNAADERMARIPGTSSTVAIQSISVSPTSVVGGSSVTATVTLTAPAPSPSGASVSLSSSDPSAQVPLTVTVAAGATSATAPVTTTPVSSTKSAVVTATYNGSATTTLTVNPPSVISVSLSTSTVVGGNPLTGTVTLNGNAPSGGATVALASQPTGVATPDASVTVAAGQRTSPNFNISTIAVTQSQTVAIKATYNGTASSNLTVTPAQQGVQSVVCSPSSVSSGTNPTCTVTLNLAATQTLTVTLMSSDTNSATVPSSVPVNLNSRTATFTATTKSVGSAKVVTITATLQGGGTPPFQTTSITVNPLISSVSASPSPIPGGSGGTLTVTLPAPTSTTLTIDLSPNSGTVILPTTMTISSGSLGSVLFTTSQVCNATPITLQATLGSASKSTSLTVNPVSTPTVSQVAGPDPTTTPSAVTWTVTLGGPASCGGTLINLTSSRPAYASVPSSVTVPQGANHATFTIQCFSSRNTITPLITATNPLNNSQASDTITITGTGGPVAPGGITAGAISSSSPWYMTYRDAQNRLSTEYTLPATTSPGTRTRDYFYLGNLLVATQDPSCGTRYYISDHLGTPRRVLNSSGTLVEAHNYQPYGSEINPPSGSCQQPLKLAGMEQDQSSGNDYDHARFHLTGAGRFLGVDSLRSIPGARTWNRYSYTPGNPVSYLDPNGLYFIVTNDNDRAYFRHGIQIGTRNQAGRELFLRLAHDLAHPFVLTTGSFPRRAGGQQFGSADTFLAPYKQLPGLRLGGGLIPAGDRLIVDRDALSHTTATTDAAVIYHEFLHLSFIFTQGVAFNAILEKAGLDYNNFSTGQIGIFQQFGENVVSDPNDPDNALSEAQVDQELHSPGPIESSFAPTSTFGYGELNYLFDGSVNIEGIAPR